MKIGVWLVMAPDELVDFARKAEAIGCESLWVPEHLVWPATISSPYPYSGNGAPPVTAAVPLYDPWVLLSAAASVTRTIRLGTCVYVLPLRHPLVTARAVATLDLVSGGRAILGSGLGWMAEEFAAVGVEFRTRGSRCDEIVPLLRALWSEDVVEHRGRHFTIPPVHFEPKPPQGASLPIVFGGVSEAALARAARLGDGWLGLWHDPEALLGHIARLHELLAAAGREPAGFEITVMVDPSRAEPEHLRRLGDLGVDRALVGSPRLWAHEWPAVLDRLGPVIQTQR